ncbi:MAG: four helix bundle protein [Dysgonamonadaceae bacterium]|jgi:four helix bundle protein|nr:four helix bundle protein [Dysgonamonadaceae bacterium]
MERKTGNRIVDLTFDFALKIVAFSEQLEDEKKFDIAKRLVRSGTSIGAIVQIFR